MKPAGAVRLYVVPIGSRGANEFVSRYHRHNKPVVASLCQVAVADGSGLVRGIATVSTPVARALVDGWTAEVLRTCTDGAQNANSMLYGAAWRAVQALGYRRLVTYTQCAETGSSLRAVGFTRASFVPASAGWQNNNRKHRVRNLEYLSTERWRWEMTSGAPRPECAIHMPVNDAVQDVSLFDGELA